MMLAANAQQHGLANTTASNGAFITSLYVVFVPFLTVALHRHRLGGAVWCGVILAAIGLLLLGVQRDFTINAGDPWVLLCAVLWAVHVVVVGIFSRDAEPIRFFPDPIGNDRSWQSRHHVRARRRRTCSD